MKVDFSKAAFLKSAFKSAEFPLDNGSELAFVGRSNSGKSSAINALTKKKNLARTSKTPGRTQLINFFEITEKIRLVDLPGYGFAKVPPKIQQHWQKLIQEYFTERSSLKGVVVLMDSRHPLSPLDQDLIHWIKQQNLPLIILLSKVDKLNRQEQQKALQLLETWLTQENYRDDNVKVISFSVSIPAALDKLSSSLFNLL